MLVCTLLLRYCITMFANLAVAGFWTCCWCGHCGFGGGRADVCVEEVHWVSVLVLGGKEFDKTEQTLHTSRV